MKKTVNGFDDDEGEVERDPDCEGFAEARRRMGVSMGMTMSVMGHERGRNGPGTSRSPLADAKYIDAGWMTVVGHRALVSAHHETTFS